MILLQPSAIDSKWVETTLSLIRACQHFQVWWFGFSLHHLTDVELADGNQNFAFFKAYRWNREEVQKKIQDG